MRYVLLLPAVLFALAGCVNVHEAPSHGSSTTETTSDVATPPPPMGAPVTTSTTVTHAP